MGGKPCEVRMRTPFIFAAGTTTRRERCEDVRGAGTLLAQLTFSI
jgi:hypothetical protein